MKKRNWQEGKIHIYSGDGKGKTTASVGLAVRAAGYGLNVLFTQFLKNGKSSELKILKKIPGIRLLLTKPISKFVFLMNQEEKEKTKKLTQEYFEEIIRIAREKQIDLLIMDEILGALTTGMLAEEKLLKFIQEKPKNLEMVLTGRDPSEPLIDIADYYSKIESIKHPYETEGLKAREGIEF